MLLCWCGVVVVVGLVIVIVEYCVDGVFVDFVGCDGVDFWLGYLVDFLV